MRLTKYSSLSAIFSNSMAMSSFGFRPVTSNTCSAVRWMMRPASQAYGFGPPGDDFRVVELEGDAASWEAQLNELTPKLTAARELVAAAAPLIAERGLTLLGFSVSNIDRAGAQQLELPFDSQPDLIAVDSAIDHVRRRFGNSALTRGVLVGRDPGLEMPMLPEWDP